MTRSALALTSLAALLLPARASAQPDPLCPTRFVDGAFVESSTGPYAPGDVFEATLYLSTPTAGEDIGVSTMVVDFNDAAMTYAAAPVKGVDYVWLRYDGFPRPTVDGGVAAYNGEVRVTNASRLVPFPELQFSTSATGRGEALPTTPTAVLKMRWTVVDATQGIVVTPRSQQWYTGPGGPTGCYSTGTWTGLEVGQQTVTGVAGWRMLAPPAGGLSPDGLAPFNHLQGIPGYSPAAGANLYAGYDGAQFGLPASADGAFAPGTGLLWYLYDAADFPGGSPPPSFHALPMTLRHAGAAAASFRAGGSIGADAASIPLHAAGQGWNLVGNPFATALDVTQLAAVGGAFAETTVQVWDPGPGGSGSYLLSTLLGGKVGGWQGFFLRNATATSASAPAAARATAAPFVTLDAPPDSAAARTATHTVAFTLDGTVGTTPTLDRAIVLLIDPDASPGWDPADATKLTPLVPAYAVLAFVGTQNGAPVLKAQDARPLPDDGFEVPLALDVVGGTAALTLHWDPAALPDVAASLADLATGETVDLHAADNYTFASAPTRPAPAARGAQAMPVASLVAAEERFVLSVGRGSPVASAAAPAVTELALDVPAPNPFRDRATVRFALPTAGSVRVAVYDVLGREVAVLVDGEQPAGRHEVTLRSEGLAAGLYVVRLTVGGAALVRRATLAR